MPIHIIVCMTHKTFGIGKDGSIPWNIPEDIKRFRDLTISNTVVMGRKTYESLSIKPLDKRKNIVITKNPDKHALNSDIYFTIDDVNNYILKHNTTTDIFIAGGEYLYREFLSIADTVYATIIEKEYDCDTFFPIDHLHQYDIKEYSSLQYSEKEHCAYRYITYTRRRDSINLLIPHEEFNYLNLINNIIYMKGQRRDRTAIGTKSIFGCQLKFSIDKYIPLITTKYVPYKMIIKELLWFLRGDTDSKILEKQGVHIWNGNTSREFLDNRGLHNYKEGDIGPMYGFNWRHFGAEYHGADADYTGKGFDQLEKLISDLQNDPYSRRHMMTTFNPSVIDQSVLAPCHGIVIQFYVHDDIDENNDAVKYLSCHMYQRSSDTGLGLVFNIASYTILTHIIAKKCGMKPHKLIVSTGDTHVYLNHIEKLEEQLKRNPLPFPILEIDDSVITKDIKDITVDDVSVIGYLHHPAIKLDMAV